jgi:hypothetical protein
MVLKEVSTLIHAGFYKKNKINFIAYKKLKILGSNWVWERIEKIIGKLDSTNKKKCMFSDVSFDKMNVIKVFFTLHIVEKVDWVGKKITIDFVFFN